MNRKVLYVLSAVLVLSGLATSFRMGRDGLHDGGCDLTYRMNEVQCSHTGVNPFDVWDQKVTTERFRGLDRNDKPPPSSQDRHKLVVHAYPPWHTTYCWFYGWLPRPITTALLGVVYGFSLVFLIVAIKRRISSFGIVQQVFVWSWLVAMLLGSLVSCFGSLQYSLPIAALAMLMYDSLDRDRDCLAAVCWALMMVKPQVGALQEEMMQAVLFPFAVRQEVQGHSPCGGNLLRRHALACVGISCIASRVDSPDSKDRRSV